MCNAIAKHGSPCKVRRGLVNGLCGRHAPRAQEATQRCDALLTRGPRRDQQCGALATQEGKCNRHKVAENYSIVVVSESGMSCFGPYSVLSVCLDAARDLFEEDFEEKEMSNSNEIAHLGSPSMNVSIVRMVQKVPPKRAVETCAHIFSKGQKKGQRCTKKAHGVFCATHSVRPRFECAHVFGKGPRKGGRCPKKVDEEGAFCATHRSPTPSASPAASCGAPSTPIIPLRALNRNDAPLELSKDIIGLTVKYMDAPASFEWNPPFPNTLFYWDADEDCFALENEEGKTSYPMPLLFACADKLLEVYEAVGKEYSLRWEAGRLRLRIH